MHYTQVNFYNIGGCPWGLMTGRLNCLFAFLP